MAILRILKKWIGTWIRILYRCVYKHIPVDDKLVIFISFHGRGYSDNPRAIYEAMIKDPAWEGYRFIWFIKNHKKKNLSIPNAKIVEYFSIPYFYYLSKAKIWIVNCKLPLYICKKEEQVYLQTWHGTPLKRLAHDIHVDPSTTFYRSAVSYEQMCHSYDVDVARYNAMISPNAFCTEVFPSAFGINKERLIETGYPRNDFISNVTNSQIDEIKERYHIPKDKKVLLYAPTWRDNSYVSAGYTFDLKADFLLWKQILKEDWVLIFKPHYLIINKFKDDPKLEGFLFSIPASAEINELYVISDALVTDYSSVFFDYAILDRPMYFYMYDMESYVSDLRGFYLDITKELPGTIYKDEKSMVEDIAKNRYDYDKLKTFKKRFNNLDDGKASHRVLRYLEEVR